MHSSSVHNWNSDEGLTHPQKVLWMLLNVVNNSWFPNVRDHHLAVRDFEPDLGSAGLGQGFPANTIEVVWNGSLCSTTVLLV